jgi:REP element-mobilizing transposase RayT
VFRPGDVDLLAWALLINHYHLLIRVTDATPESLFRRLNTAVGMPQVSG